MVELGEMTTYKHTEQRAELPVGYRTGGGAWTDSEQATHPSKADLSRHQTGAALQASVSGGGIAVLPYQSQQPPLRKSAPEVRGTLVGTMMANERVSFFAVAHLLLAALAGS